MFSKTFLACPLSKTKKKPLLIVYVNHSNIQSKVFCANVCGIQLEPRISVLNFWNMKIAVISKFDFYLKYSDWFHCKESFTFFMIKPKLVTPLTNAVRNLYTK